jgi:branched-subunit amino acid aminotransferase/4-amino-4-deoxychorismate lyase
LAHLTAVPALIETARAVGGRLPLLSLHNARLSIGCRALGIPFPGPLEVPERVVDGIVRFEVSVGGVKTTLRSPSLSPGIPRSPNPADPIRLILSDVAHRPYRHKTTDRGQFDDVLARARLREADDGLMLTLDGHVAECAIWSVFWWEGERLICPPLELGILPGVARARLSQLVPLEERRVGPLALAGRPIFVANAARGVVEVGSFNDRSVPADPRTGELAGRFWG